MCPKKGEVNKQKRSNCAKVKEKRWRQKVDQGIAGSKEAGIPTSDGGPVGSGIPK
jgi:hypothetical protein